MKSLLLNSSQSLRGDSHVNPILRKRPPSFAMVEQESKTATIGDLAVKVTVTTTAALSLSAASQSMSSSDASSHGEDNWLETQTINQVDLVSARSRKQRNKSSTKQDSHPRRSRSPVRRHSREEFEFSKTLMNKAREDGVDKKMVKRNLEGHRSQSKVQSRSRSTRRSRGSKRNKENLWMIYNSMNSTSVMGKESNGSVIEENAIKGAGDTHESKSNNPVEGDITSEAHKWAFKMFNDNFLHETSWEKVRNAQFPETSKWIVDSGIVPKEDEEKLGKIYDALMKFLKKSKDYLMQNKDAQEGYLDFSSDAIYTMSEKLHLKRLLDSKIDSPSIDSTKYTSAECKKYYALYHLFALRRIQDYEKLKDAISSSEDPTCNLLRPYDLIMDRYDAALASFLVQKAGEEAHEDPRLPDKREESSRNALRDLEACVCASSLRERQKNCRRFVEGSMNDIDKGCDRWTTRRAVATVLLPNLEEWENDFRDLLSLVNPGDECWDFINLVRSGLAEREAVEALARKRREAVDPESSMFLNVVRASVYRRRK